MKTIKNSIKRLNQIISKQLITILIILISVTLNAQNTYVPDDNFEQELINMGYDDVLDDYVATANINTISFLNISYADFSNFSDYKKDCYELIKSEYNNKNLENYVYNYSYNETSD
jgi:hypothetical protein